MTWYDKNYKKRQMIGVDVFGGSGSSATIDIEIEVPKDWDAFWDEIKSDMKDIVVTNPLGEMVTFAHKAGANYSTRTLTLQVDGYASNHDNSMNALWVYYGDASETTDHTSSVTISSAKNGYILLERPYARVVPSQGGQSATDAPITSFNKSSIDQIDVFFLTSGFLGKRLQNYNERDGFEAIDYVQVFSYDNSGTNSNARYDVADTRLGNNFIRARYKAGDSGSDYAVAIEIFTTEKQVIQSRAILRVKNLLPE
tara:strand:+ start:2424 stop:3188 length:765 start_codon:yes stop_codon:yes gene_type:complete